MPNTAERLAPTVVIVATAAIAINAVAKRTAESGGDRPFAGLFRDTENAPKPAVKAAAIQPGCWTRSGRINAGGSFEQE